MKEIIKKIIKIICKIIKSFWAFLSRASSYQSNLLKQKESKKDPIKKINDKMTVSSEDDSSDTSKERFKEYKKKLEKNQKKEIEKELYKTIEKVFAIKIKNLSLNEEKKLKDYCEKIQKKIEKEHLVKKEIKEFIHNEVNIVFQIYNTEKKYLTEEKREYASTNLEVKEEQKQESLREKVVEEKELKNDEKKEIYKDKSLPLDANNIPNQELSNTIQREYQKKENQSYRETIKNNFVKESSKDYPKQEVVSKDYQKKEVENKYSEENLAPVSFLQSTAEKKFVEQNLELLEREETVVLETEEEPMKEENVELKVEILKENQNEIFNNSLPVQEVEVLKVSENRIMPEVLKSEIITEVIVKNESKSEKSEPTLPLEKKENNLKDEKKSEKEIPKEKTYDEIDIDSLKKDVEEITNKTEIELEKEEFEDKEYEKIEKLINQKILECEAILEKCSLKQNKLVSVELNKLKNLQSKVYVNKTKELEQINFNLEEIIWGYEKEEVMDKIKKLNQNMELETEELMLQKTLNKSQEEIKALEKYLLKQQLKRTYNHLKIPLFLSFPFVKNKYFRMFVGGVFLESSFHFMKRILFGAPKKIPDFSSIQKGQDALEKYRQLLVENIYTFENIKIMTFQKYPELMEDEEFMSYLNGVQNNLNEEYEKMLKNMKVMNQYFYKTKSLNKTLKRRIV